jgi:hypothetical protein
MTYGKDTRIHEKSQSLRKVFHKLCGKLVENLSKQVRNMLTMKSFLRFALRCDNRKNPVVSTTIQEIRYLDVIDCQKNRYS